MKDESIMELMAGIKVLADEIVPPNKTRQSLRAGLTPCGSSCSGIWPRHTKFHNQLFMTWGNNDEEKV